MKNRRKARELTLQILYQMDVRETPVEEALNIAFSRYRFRSEVKQFAESLIRGTSRFLLPIDFLIKKYAKNWTLERMATVDRNILRFTIYELLFLENVPPIVSINEAVEIAKRYGTSDSGKFVNGILDKIRQERGPGSSLNWTYLKNSLQKDAYLKELIRIKGKEKLWLVGGCLRDLLLGREKRDLDVVLEDPEFRIVQLFVSQVKASLVVLNSTLRRVVFPGKATIDFILKKSQSLNVDLLQRDFTINALALDLDFLAMPRLALIDPETGLEDLINKKIRLLREKSLEEDPLRMLRAFRLASQLDFEVEEEIAHLISSKSSLIKKVAGERIRDELCLFLKNPFSHRYLVNFSAEVLLEKIFGQTPNLENLKRLETLLSKEKVLPKDLKEKINLHLEKNEKTMTSRRDLLKIMALIFLPAQEKLTLSGVGKRLKLSRAYIKIMQRVERLYPKLKKIIGSKKNTQLIAEFLIEAKKELVETSLLLLVVNFGEPASSRLMIRLLKEYFKKSSLILHPSKLIGGKELMKVLRIPAGPYISYLLNKIHQAQVMEEVKTKEEAIEYTKKIAHEIDKGKDQNHIIEAPLRGK
jgi:tRNA nucleotidyltransferase (CCA-adding enzyme)